MNKQSRIHNLIRFVILGVLLITTACAPFLTQEPAVTPEPLEFQPVLSYQFLPIRTEHMEYLEAYDYGGGAIYYQIRQYVCIPDAVVEISPGEFAVWDPEMCIWTVWDTGEFPRMVNDDGSEYDFAGMFHQYGFVQFLYGPLVDADGNIIIGQSGDERLFSAEFQGYDVSRKNGFALHVTVDLGDRTEEGYIRMDTYFPDVPNYLAVPPEYDGKALGAYKHDGLESVYFEPDPGECVPTEKESIDWLQMAIWNPTLCEWDVIQSGGNVLGWKPDDSGSFSSMLSPMISRHGDVLINQTNSDVAIDVLLIGFDSSRDLPLEVQIEGSSTTGWISFQSFMRDEFFLNR